MTDSPTEPPDAVLAADWVTIWQSEWAALAVDPEVREAWQRMAGSWAMPADADRQSPTPIDAASRRARPVPPARPAAAADAPDARDLAIASLLDRVAELERRAARPATELAARPATELAASPATELVARPAADPAGC